MSFIIVEDIQVPAKKFDELENAREDASEKEVIVRNNDGQYWVIDEEDYAKIEAYGYELVEK
ncbi:hypothetical protein SAMN05421781_2350 [Marinococcus luteus]|uniref:Uncharacterized protein n=1 Tax=Marinococcus luteus TaxID=1122204 RepID=A0A1H2WBH4_9BACI|nr:hypothetical protein [Marinococcus luteus]SDW77887.1 hypothetical protein SAMN05421781_2350 [Marinococcus luteus]